MTPDQWCSQSKNFGGPKCFI